MTVADRLRVLAADDERPALDALVAGLEADERVGAVLRATGGAEALRLLAAEDVDAAFLDLHMPGLDGFDLAAALGRFERPPAVVFVTADESGAVRAFDLDAADYLLKPIRQDRLARAIGRVEAVLGATRDGGAGAAGAGAAPDGATAPDDETIEVRTGNVTRVLHRSEVRWVQSHGDYLRLHTESGGWLVRESLADLEDRWARHGFLRVHRSFLVLTRAITSARLSGGQPAVTVAGQEIPVSRRLVRQVRDAMLGGGA